MTTYFISDLHLQKEQPEITAIFLRFIQQQARQADALYILGDLFEVWLGDDDSHRFVQIIKQNLATLVKSGVPVFFIRGNRDFAIGERFAKETGITILSDPTVVNLYGKPILLMHGDLLCTDDIKYQAFRRKISNPRFVKRLLWLPLWIRRAIAAWARSKSKKHTQSTNLTIQDVNLDTVQKYLQDYSIATLIHGHTHRPDEHTITLPNSSVAKRIVLAAWHEQGEALELTAKGEFKRIILRSNQST